ncbi:MAG: N-acetyltransferase [Chloroflexi bacterium]|nr:N-acetyltransferase [Chloroflexota bacterium]
MPLVQTEVNHGGTKRVLDIGGYCPAGVDQRLPRHRGCSLPRLLRIDRRKQRSSRCIGSGIVSSRSCRWSLRRAGGSSGMCCTSPRTLRVMGQDIGALILGPLGVLPEWQGRGVGSVLMRAGDDLARTLGYPFVVLLGHDTYYPRFGYVGNAFGFSTLTLRAGAALHLFEGAVEARPVQAGDEPALMALWRIEEAGGRSVGGSR